MLTGLALRLAITNNLSMTCSASQIVERLGGTNKAARFFSVRPPSVSEWVKKGEIPDDRLIKNAARLERALPGEFSRVAQWPDDWREIWPELASEAATASAEGDARE